MNGTRALSDRRRGTLDTYCRRLRVGKRTAYTHLEEGATLDDLRAAVESVQGESVFTVTEIAAKFRIKVHSVYRLIRRGELEAVVIGRKTIRVTRSQLMSFLGEAFPELFPEEAIR